MYWGPPKPESGPERKGKLAPDFKDEVSLSDVNPLFHPLDLTSPSSVESFNTVTLGLIDRYGGLKPDVIKSGLVSGNDPDKPAEDRFIARWEVSGLTRRKIRHLEDLVRYVYGSNARTTRSPEGVNLPAVTYPSVDSRSIEDRLHTRFEGWYMGPNTAGLDTLHKGLFLFKDVGVTNAHNFLEASQAKRPRFLIEIREGGLYQTDLANLVVETASILGKKAAPTDYGQLMYDSYYALMRMGLKKEEDGYEIDQILNPILRGLILPLASPRLAKALDQEPESALLVGVSGTGKSLAARKLFYLDTGVFVVPLDPIQLVVDILKPPEKRELLPRIAQVRSFSQRPVVLQLDDVEKYSMKIILLVHPFLI